MSHSIKSISGIAAHLEGHNIDTDRIVPARFLKTTTFESMASALFFDDRHLDGQPDPRHPLNRQPKPALLVVDSNFGCGSSREHAAQACLRWGIQGLIGLSFGDIFRGNCHALGVPCVTIDETAHQALTAILHHGPTELTLNLDDLTVKPTGTEANSTDSWPCQLPAAAREAFLSGTYDPLEGLLRHKLRIQEFHQNHPMFPSQILQPESRPPLD
jgi:3-isopropylmalate/(R)-2-methylmalate dehydratase small subunit